MIVVELVLFSNYSEYIVFICFTFITNLHWNIDVTSGLDLRLKSKHLADCIKYLDKHILKLYTGMFQMVDCYHVVDIADWCWCLVPRKRYFDVRLLNQRNFIIKIICFKWNTANTKTDLHSVKWMWGSYLSLMKQ